MWRVIKNTCDITEKSVLLGGENLNIFQEVAQGCSMSAILFINQLLDEFETAGIGITMYKEGC